MIVIHGAEVYNPARGHSPQTGDLWIDGGRIIAPHPGAVPEQVIDASHRYHTLTEEIKNLMEEWGRLSAESERLAAEIEKYTG